MIDQLKQLIRYKFSTCCNRCTIVAVPRPQSAHPINQNHYNSPDVPFQNSELASFVYNRPRYYYSAAITFAVVY